LDLRSLRRRLDRLDGGHLVPPYAYAELKLNGGLAHSGPESVAGGTAALAKGLPPRPRLDPEKDAAGA